MKQSIRFGLKTKFLAPTIALFVIAMGSSTLISYNESKKALEEAMLEQVNMIADSTFRELTSWIDDAKADISNWSSQQLYRDATLTTNFGQTAKEAASLQMSTIVEDYGYYEALALLDPEGEIIAASNPDMIGETVPEEQFFQEALADTLFMTPFVQSRVSERPVFIISSPVRSEDEIVGVLFGVVTLAYFAHNTLENIRIGEAGYAYMLNTDGLVLTHPDEALVANFTALKSDLNGVIQTFLKEKNGIITYRWEGIEKNAIYRTHEALEGILVITANTDELFAPAIKIGTLNFVLTAAITIIATLVIYLITRSIITPINQIITETAHAITEGDFTKELKITARDDEIGLLAEAFRSMQESIAQVLDETLRLSQAIQEGDLKARGNTETFSGDWQTLVVGINNIIEAFIEPIGITAASLRQIARGTIPALLTEAYQGDFKTIQEDLNAMIHTLETFTIEIRRAAAQVDSGSQHLNMSAAQMSEGASRQAASSEEISSTMEQIAANIRQNAENAVQTAQIAQRVAGDARQSGEAVAQTIQAIKGIAHTIKIIEEIAQQTNMLSLNATIEAAKAEEHGRGFAVVAAEVRSLAKRSQEAAEEINQLASSSVTIAENAGTMLVHLVPTIESTSDLVQEISAASNEQKIGVEQINESMQQLDLVTQQNAAISKETSGTAETLLQEAEQLQKVVAFFRTIESKHDAQEQSLSLHGASHTRQSIET